MTGKTPADPITDAESAAESAAEIHADESDLAESSEAESGDVHNVESDGANSEGADTSESDGVASEESDGVASEESDGAISEEPDAKNPDAENPDAEKPAAEESGAEKSDAESATGESVAEESDGKSSGGSDSEGQDSKSADSSGADSGGPDSGVPDSGVLDSGGDGGKTPPAKLTPGRAVIGTGLMSMLAVAALGITRFVHTSLVGNHLEDSARFGAVGVMIAISTVSSLALPAGVASAMVRFIPYHLGAGADATARSMYRFLSRIGLVGAAVLGVGAALIAPMFVAGIGIRDIILVGLLTFSFSVYSFDKNAMYGFNRVGSYVKLELSTSVLTILITIAMLFTSWQGYVLPLVLGYSIFVIVSRWIIRSDVRGEKAPAGSFDRGEVISFVVIACFGTLSSTGFLWGTNLLAAGLTVAAATGYFTAAIAILQPMNLLPRALNMALFPAMAHAQGSGDTEAVRRHSDISTRALFVLLAPLFAAAIPLAPILMRVTGREQVPGAPILQVMLVATYLSVVQVASVNALSAGNRRQFRLPATCAVSGAVVGLIAIAVMAPKMGAMGVAVGYLVGTAVIAGGPIAITWRLHRMAWTGMVIRSLVVVAISGVVCVALNRVGLIGGFNGTLSAVGAAIGVSAVGVAVLWRDLRELAKLARNRGRTTS